MNPSFWKTFYNLLISFLLGVVQKEVNLEKSSDFKVTTLVIILHPYEPIRYNVEQTHPIGQ